MLVGECISHGSLKQQNQWEMEVEVYREKFQGIGPRDADRAGLKSPGQSKKLEILVQEPIPQPRARCLLREASVLSQGL